MKAYIFINGILNLPSASTDWNDLAVTWTLKNLQCAAEKFEYFALPLTRRVFQARHADALLTLLNQYRDHDLTIVAHSNGADLAVRALQEFGGAVDELHLFSPACDSDCLSNGLDIRLSKATLGRLAVYIAGQDRAMWWAQLSRTLTGWMGLGYGTMGKDGPIDVSLYNQRQVTTIREPLYGHSDWFLPENFERTMRLICPQTPTTTPNQNQ